MQSESSLAHVPTTNMTFPASPRVLYKKHPLERVICQLRFPPILRVDSEEPTAYQEAVRTEYPLYRDEQAVNLVPNLPPELAQIIKLSPVGAKSTVKSFVSADEGWTIALSREFIALSTRRYERWEEFRRRLLSAVEPFEQIYKPSFYTRVGLRYTDVIQRSRYDLGNATWAELLAPHVAGELGSEIGPKIKEASHVVLIDLGQEFGSVRTRHGLTIPPQTSEQAYTIDMDFFTQQRIELDHAKQRLDYFNEQAVRLFRWYITDRLHTAMAPQSLNK